MTVPPLPDEDMSEWLSRRYPREADQPNREQKGAGLRTAQIGLPGATSRGVYRIHNVPKFEDENTGYDGCPSPLQIQERAAVVRSYWDKQRWEKALRREGVVDGDVLHSSHRDDTFKSSDAELMRWLLWTDEDPSADVLRRHHARKAAR